MDRTWHEIGYGTLDSVRTHEPIHEYPPEPENGANPLKRSGLRELGAYRHPRAEAKPLMPSYLRVRLAAFSCSGTVRGARFTEVHGRGRVKLCGNRDLG